MRRFRSNGVNLRDVRIPYIFLLSLAVLCLIMGFFMERYNNTATAASLSATRTVLENCRDSLRQWEGADSSDERYKAAVRFEAASSGLPSEVRLDKLNDLVSEMKDGSADVGRVRSLAEIFGTLSAMDYDGPADAENVIVEAVNKIGGISGESENSQLSDKEEIPYEVLAYTRKVVKNSIRSIFDGNGGTIEPILSEDKSAWTVAADNVRMSFDAETGRLEDFVFIRLGQTPGEAADAESRLEAARAFYGAYRRCSSLPPAECVGELCGFTSVLVSDTDGSYRIGVDSHGRIWSLTKVKR